MFNWLDITNQITVNTGLKLDPGTPRNVMGGCINTCYVLGLKQQQVFVKLNRREYLDMFRTEAEGLASMSRTGAISVPVPLCVGQSGQHAFLAMRLIRFGQAGKKGYRLFGQQLAGMHRCQKKQYGSPTNNTIGLTTQLNTSTDNWIDFWREYRLGFQLQLAQKNRAPGSLVDDGMRLAEIFHHLFDHPPAASCLHGDLWQGNWGFDNNANPVIFDPAHYYGDRETDLAMVKLFGGAPEDFYRAYSESYPLDEGYPLREIFYNIYHILNHYNLFGGTYAPQAHRMIQYVLSELK